MFITPKQMRRSDAPVPPHVQAIADAQRAARAARVIVQAEDNTEVSAMVMIVPVARRRRRKARNMKRSI